MKNTSIDTGTTTRSASNTVSAEVISILQIVISCTLLGSIGFIGSICNIINIIVFVKQGFKDSTNISLLGIAIADIGALVALLWGSILDNPSLGKRFPDVMMVEIKYGAASGIHGFFTRITGVLTCLVTVERYLCVSYPLKVRSIITSRKMATANVAIYLCLAIIVLPIFTSISIGNKLDWYTNRTVVGLIYGNNALNILNIILALCNAIEIASFGVITILTVLLVFTLNKQSRWRNSNLKSVKPTSTKDDKVVMMVIFIAICFIICYFPTILYFFMRTFNADFDQSALRKQLNSPVTDFIYFLEAINATSGLFIYLKMSSKFRQMFMTIFTNKSHL